MENARAMLDSVQRCQHELHQITGMCRELQREEQHNAQGARNQATGWQSGGTEPGRFEPGRPYGATGFSTATAAYDRATGWGYNPTALGSYGTYGATGTLRPHEENVSAQLRRIEDSAQRCESELRWVENALHSAEGRFGGFGTGPYSGGPAGTFASPSSRRYR